MGSKVRPQLPIWEEVYTDNGSHTIGFKPDKSITGKIAARMQRYALFLSGLQYDIEYKSTTAHGNADCLSRLPLAKHGNGDSEDDKMAHHSLHI